MFFVYDRTGKEELLSKAILRCAPWEKKCFSFRKSLSEAFKSSGRRAKAASVLGRAWQVRRQAR